MKNYGLKRCLFEQSRLEAKLHSKFISLGAKLGIKQSDNVLVKNFAIVIFGENCRKWKLLSWGVYKMIQCLLFLWVAICFAFFINETRVFLGVRSEAYSHKDMSKWFRLFPVLDIPLRYISLNTIFLGTHWSDFPNFCINNTTCSRSIIFQIFSCWKFFRRVISDENFNFGFF